MKNMKKTMLIAAAAAELLLTACGSVDESSEAKTTTAAPAVSQSEPAESEAPEVPASEDESVPDEDQDPSSEDVSVPDKTEPDMTWHEWLLFNIKDASFESPDSGTVSFRELVEQGKANSYAEGRAYALISAGGGAGHVYYDFYFTDCAGITWTKQDEPLDLFSGPSCSFALDDGRLMFLTERGVYDDPAPVLITLSFDGIAVTTETNEDWLKGIELDDGTVYDGSTHVDFSARKIGDYYIELVLADSEDGSILLQRKLALDPETLAITEPEEPEETEETEE